MKLWGAAALGFLLGAVLLVPLRLVVPDGISAAGARGTIWGGTLEGANWRGTGIGDVALALQPLGLLRGDVRLGLGGGLEGGGLEGVVIAGWGVEGLSGRRALSGLPVDSVAARDVTLGFEDGRCVAASGSLSVTMPGQAAPLVATPRCAGAGAILAFASADGLEGLTISIAADGQMSVTL